MLLPFLFLFFWLLLDGSVAFENESRRRRRIRFGSVRLAKDLSLPKFEIKIAHKTFIGNSGSCATGPRPKLCTQLAHKCPCEVLLPTAEKSQVLHAGDRTNLQMQKKTEKGKFCSMCQKMLSIGMCHP
jgi:hypothetical protein